MRSLFVVMLPPLFKDVLRLADAREDVLVEAFVAKPCVEALDEGSLGLRNPHKKVSEVDRLCR